jgi:hypothetical protein
MRDNDAIKSQHRFVLFVPYVPESKSGDAREHRPTGKGLAKPSLIVYSSSPLRPGRRPPLRLHSGHGEIAPEVSTCGASAPDGTIQS